MFGSKMIFHYIHIFLFIYWNAYVFALPSHSNRKIRRNTRDENSLILVHVLFRHGNRTPNGPEEQYPKDPYLNETYFPFGIGQLTNAGKRKEYSIGEALRQRYDAFLGPYYYPQLIEPISTDYNRTKMSLELVLASLFPPKRKQIWNVKLDWQPIPYTYLSIPEDKVLVGQSCPHYLKLYDEFVQSLKSKIQAKSKIGDIFKYISQNTGLNIEKYQDVYNLYFGLKAEEEYFGKLPSWTEKVWPKIITDLAVKEYFVASGTTQMKKMASGYFLQKLITDTQTRINGTNNVRKLYLYSAHENNIALVMIALGMFKPPHIPNYGAYLIFEVHKINNKYGIKIYYENYTEKKIKLLKLPDCESFCTLDQFIRLTKEYIPEENLCFQQSEADGK